MIIAAKAATGGGEAPVIAMLTDNVDDQVYYSRNLTTWDKSAVYETNAVGRAAGLNGNSWLVGTDQTGGAGTGGEIWYTDSFSSWSNATEVYTGTNVVKNRFRTSGTTTVLVGSRNDAGTTRWGIEYTSSVATWSNGTANITTAGEAFGVTTDGTTWLVCGDGSSGSNCYTVTTLGNNWTARTVGISSLTAAAVGGGVWVVTNGSGLLRSSTDLTTWTARTSGFGTSVIFSVIYANNIFVAVGEAGKISTSTDGTTWTARTSGTAFDIRDVAWSATAAKFVACGGNNEVLTSSDGITWSKLQVVNPAVSTFVRVATQ